MKGFRLIIYGILLALGYFSIGRVFITGFNPNACYIAIMVLILGTIFTVTKLQKLELGRFKTLTINIILVSLLFLSFYVGLNSIEIPPGTPKSYYQEKE